MFKKRIAAKGINLDSECELGLKAGQACSGKTFKDSHNVKITCKGSNSLRIEIFKESKAKLNISGRPGT